MELIEKWKEHPLCVQGLVEMVPVSWVWNYWGRDVSPQADLMDGTIVTQDELWKNIQEEGMHTPLIMRVGLNNKKFRLESGNHRIQVFHKNGIPSVPLVVQVREECGPHLNDVMTDATRNFEAGDEFLITKITQEYMRPSEVFKSLRKS